MIALEKFHLCFGSKALAGLLHHHWNINTNLKVGLCPPPPSFFTYQEFDQIVGFEESFRADVIAHSSTVQEVQVVAQS